MNRVFRITLLVPSLLFLLIVSPSAREFTSTDGRKLQGEVISVKEEIVIMKVGTRNLTVRKDLFCESDRKYFEEWAINEAKNKIPKLEVFVSSGKSDRRDRNDYFDDRKGSFQVKVKIENEEQSFDITGATARLVVLGESCEDDDWYLVMQENKFKLDIPAGKTFEWEGKKVSYEFDEGYPAKWGHKYKGYALEVKNSSGKTIYRNAIPTKFDKSVDALVALKYGQEFDKNLETVRRGSTAYIKN